MWKLARFVARSRRFSTAIPGPCIVHKRGADILHDPWFNKDTGFPMTERDRLGLRGLLPPRVISFEQQYDRFMNSYRSLEKNTQGQPDKVVSLAKWRILNRLHDRNETLYYRVLIDNIKEFAPIIYTPTVGLVCQNYSGLFRRPRGMYFSARDKGEMMSMIYNWPAHQVDMIVLTDGSRILGLGDLGVQGIGIPIGKLDVYVAAAGINPQRILPVMLDVGTNNQKLLEDRLYLGLRQPRLEGEEYLSIVDEFMEAVNARWPKAIVQFEDFQMKWAFETLERYHKRFCMFNDDIQGTAGVALAGLLGTVRAQGRPLSDFVNQKIVVVGAGSAGLGVLKMAIQAVAKMSGCSESAAKSQFFLIDKNGLVTTERNNLDPAAAPFAKNPRDIEGLSEGASIIDVVKKVKPHVLLGLSGVGGIFNEEVLKAMRESVSTKPAIFAMSNPTMNAECTAIDAFNHAGENIVFASGSPFENVDLGNGKVGHVNQANNMYLFPGIGLGTLLSGAHLITDGMLRAASEWYAVVTGANKGIGLEIVRQLALAGIKVVLTARDAKRGLEALETLKASGLPDLVVFHQLDVADATSAASLADFVKSKFGKLDILVNNAGINGFVIKDKDLFMVAMTKRGALSEDDERKATTQTYESAKECLLINYYGAKTTTESLLPLLQLSDSPRIVNVSSALGRLKNVPNDWAIGVLSDADNLTVEKVDEVLKRFLEDFQEGSLESKGWPRTFGAYIMSKAAMNAYTQILAKNFPSFCINSVCPGYVKTDINANTGFFTVEEGAASAVRLALLPNGSPSGLFYIQNKVSSITGVKSRL